MADFTEAYRTLRWMMGDLDVGSFEPILGALPLIAGAFLIFAALPSSLNLLSVGSDIAATRGVDVARTQRLASARPWPRVPRSRWQGRSDLSASSSRISCG